MIGVREKSVMSAPERELLMRAAKGQEPVLASCSDTYIDTGRWWRTTPVWVCVTKDKVVLLAAGKRQYVEGFDRTECRDSYYCHIVGGIVLVNKGNSQPRFGHLRMSPLDGLRVLDAIREDGT